MASLAKPALFTHKLKFIIPTNWVIRCKANTVVQKLFYRKYFIDNEFQGKIFLWIHNFLRIFLPWTYNASDTSHSVTLPQWSDWPYYTLNINTYSYYSTIWHSVPYIILLILPFMQGEVQSGYSELAYSFINHRLLAPAWRWPGYVRQVRATASCSSI